MSKLTLKSIAVAGIVLLVSASPMLWAEGQEETAEPVEQACVAIDAETPVPMEQSIKPKPGPNCLPSQPLTCAQMPIPAGGTCSCESTLLHKKCKTCDTGAKGQELRTTCTVYAPCQTSPCEPQQNFSRTGRSCAS